MRSGIQRSTAGRVLRLILLSLPALFLAARADGALLGLVKEMPDITAVEVKVHYNATTDKFTANGVATLLNYDGTPAPGLSITDGSFKIDVTIDSLGNPVLGPSNILEVYGRVPSKGITDLSQPLIKGTLSEFGFKPVAGSRLFEFRFDLTGGQLADDFDTIGSVGVILNTGNINFQGHFNNTFHNLAGGYMVATADVYGEVPEPASLAMWSLFGLGVGAAGWSRRRKLQQSRGHPAKPFSH